MSALAAQGAPTRELVAKGHRMPIDALRPVADVRAWQQFLAVAEELHFGRAAQRLGMTQPPLTQAIQKLELQLDVRLFERTRRSVALTAVGQSLVEPVRRLCLDAGALVELARQAEAGLSGTLRLGFVSTVGFGPLPAWLREFSRRYPQVRVELTEATEEAQVSAFERRELDAGFVLQGAPPGRRAERRQRVEALLLEGRELGALEVGSEPLVLVHGSAARSRALTADECLRLLSGPLVLFPRHSAPSLHDSILAFLARLGFTPWVAQRAVQMQTIVNLVASGLGSALVPQVVQTFRRKGVRYQPLPRGLLDKAPRCVTRLVWPAKGVSSIAQRFVEHVQQRSP